MLEHALLHISAGRESEFEASIRKALPIIEEADGCHGAQVRRQDEDPSIFLLLVTWTSIEAHMTFRTTPQFNEWRSLTHTFYAEAPSVTHFHEPLSH